MSENRDAYIKIGTIKGEATEANHKEWSNVVRFDFSLHLPTRSAGVAAGGPLSFGDVQFAALRIVKTLEKSSPDLFLACCKGQVLKEVVLEKLKKVGDSTMTKSFSIKLTDAVITSYEPQDDDEEILTFAFVKIEFSYVSIGPDGKVKGTVTRFWDLKTNTGG